MADISKIKLPNGSVYDIRDDNAVPKSQVVALSDSFTVSFPQITDTNGVDVYREYCRKKADGKTVNKVWRMFSIDGSAYSDFQAYSTDKNTVNWNISGTGNFALKVNGKNVVVEGQQGSVYQTGTINNIVDGTPQSKTLTFTPTIVILYDLYGHVIDSGFSIEMGTNKFTMTPSALAVYLACKWIAFA